MIHGYRTYVMHALDTHCISPNALDKAQGASREIKQFCLRFADNGEYHHRN